MSSDDASSPLVRELLHLFEPITRWGADPASVHELFEAMGWNVEALFGPAPNPLLAAFAGISEVARAMQQFVEQPPKSIDEITRVLDCAVHVINAVDALPSKLEGTVATQQAAKLTADLAQLLTLDYLRRRAPAAVDVLRLLTLVKRQELAAEWDDTRLLREPAVVERLELERLPLLLSDPVKTLREYYFPGELAQPTDARMAGSRLFPAVVPVLNWMGAVSLTGLGSSLPLVDQDENDDFLRCLTAVWSLGDEVAAGELGFTARLLSRVEQGPGLVLVPFGTGGLGVLVGRWVVALSLGGKGGLLAITPGGILAEEGQVALQAEAEVVRATATQRPLRIGDEAGTRLELASVSIGAECSFQHDVTADSVDFGAHALVKGAKFVVAAPTGDGFLSKILPPEGIVHEFDLGLEWSKRHGLRIHGGGGVDTRLIIKKSLFGSIALDFIRLALAFDVERPSIRTCAGLAFSVNLGPLRASVDDMGLAADVLFPARGGNLGAANLALQFKPPSGIGLTVDAMTVRGGGFLSLDSTAGQYAGVMQLSIQNAVDIKALGLLNTRLPDGRPGFSLLLIVTGEFPPIQLGMGFTLNAVGGLAGINRTAAVDVLRAGLRNGALDSILFPPDPLANVPALLATVSSVFPVAEGRHVFGPMVRIGYGSPTLLTLDVAVLIELPDPVRIILLGRLKATLPDDKKPVAIIRMDAVGVLDFGRKELSLDATIYDSKILTFTLSGDMAMRLSWGDTPGFLLSVGGFHPHFRAPTGMPVLRRIAISLLDLDKNGVVARVRLESYLAITSNTLQFGALVQVYVKSLGVEVQGLLGFDALIHFPFAIEAQMVAVVSLSFNGVMLMGAEVRLDLTGPEPWHLVGEARFVLLGMKASAPLDFTVGAAGAPVRELPPPADVAGELVKALADARNWQATVAQGLPSAARVRPAAVATGTFLLMPPDAGLAVRQRVAPLNAEITRFGNALIQGGRSRFALQLGAAGAVGQPLREPFAMAQYKVMSDDDKLSSPSFEPQDAGVRIEAGGFDFGADAVIVAPQVALDTRLVDPAADASASPVARVLPAKGARRRPTQAELKVRSYLRGRAAPATSAAARQGKQRYQAPQTI